MKKNILTLTILSLALILVACGGSATEETVADPGTTSAEFSMSPEMALMLGTVKLDQTEHAIDAAQAEALLPLWKALRSISDSGTAATSEVEAIITQITNTMTAEQMDAITAMDLTREDIAGVSEILGIGMNLGSNKDSETQGTREGGEGPPQGLGAGGQGPGGSQGVNSSTGNQSDEGDGSRGASLALNAPFLDAIIGFLEAKFQ